MVTRFVTAASGRSRHARAQAFSLAEVLITVVIVGILSAIALPNYFNQVQRTRQSEAAAILTQIQNALVAYVDENRTTETACPDQSGVLRWGDLNSIAAIMTNEGPAECEKALTTSITIPNGSYTIKRKTTDSTSKTDAKLYSFIAEPKGIHTSSDEYPKLIVQACVNLSNGSSDLKIGLGSGSTSDLNKLLCTPEEP